MLHEWNISTDFGWIFVDAQFWTSVLASAISHTIF